MTIKGILKEFVAYLDDVSCSGMRDPSSPFELKVSARTLAQFEVALCAARSPDEQVVKTWPYPMNSDETEDEQEHGNLS